MRSDSGIFNFVKLRVGVLHAGAGQGKAEGALPPKPGGWTTTLVISHSKRWP